MKMQKHNGKTLRKTAKRTDGMTAIGKGGNPMNDFDKPEQRARFIGFPTEQLEKVLLSIAMSLAKSTDTGTTLTEIGYRIGESSETVRELLRAIREAKSRYRPNLVDNPHDVVLIRDLAPIV